MNKDELIQYLSWTLDMDMPLSDRRTLTNELFQMLCRENRIRAEAKGIGKESELSPKPTEIHPYHIDLEWITSDTAPELHELLTRFVVEGR